MPSASRLPALSTSATTVRSSAVRDLLALTERPGVLSFAGGLPAPELFDVEGLRRSYAAVLATGGALQYSTTEGNRALRGIVADRYTAQGLPTRADDIIVTTGSQQALTLLASVLVNPGDVVLVERPCYLAALQAFGLAGARIVEVPGDAAGIDLDAVDHLAAAHRPALLYTVPTFHNPTGRTLDTSVRARLAALAGRRGFRIVEDDPYHELRYSGRPVPAVASFDDAQAVITTGSFSKVLAPGLRLGWIRSDPLVRPALVVAKQAADLHTSGVDQAAAAHYLASGALAAGLGRAREVYRERRDAMLAGLPAALPAGSTWTTPDGGMFVWVTLPEGHDASVLLPRAVDRLVAYVPGAPFYARDPSPRTLRLSFTTYAPHDIAVGLGRLGGVLAAAGDGSR